MMLRKRASATAIEYIQKASAMSSIAHSIVCAIDGDFVIDTDAPWCKVFHQRTEK